MPNTLFTCKACECSYSLRKGEEYPVECDRCKTINVPFTPGGAVEVKEDQEVVLNNDPIIKTVFKETADGPIKIIDREALPKGPTIPFTKHDQDKLAWNLLPMTALEGVVRVLMYGAKKYEPFNWKKGTDYSRYYRAGMGHLVDFWERETLDPESKLHHLDHAICCLIFLRYYELHPDDYSPHDNRLEGRLNERKDIEVQGDLNEDDSMPALQEAV